MAAPKQGELSTSAIWASRLTDEATADHLDRLARDVRRFSVIQRQFLLTHAASRLRELASQSKTSDTRRVDL